jgi:5-formyltetrahydrofolate cyclo-ligase
MKTAEDTALRNLRLQLQAARAAQTIGYRRRAAQHVVHLLDGSRWMRPGSHIGLYASIAPELDTAPLRRMALLCDCRVYLPRIHDYRQHLMRLCRDDGRPLRLNRHGIGEPQATHCIASAGLDVVFLPVVGFDNAGRRLGMGGGYYDRLLAVHSPLLVGLAYDCAYVEQLPARPHDVPLDAVVTESGIKFFTHE